MEIVRSHLLSRQQEMLVLIERLVNIDSGFYWKQGIDACGRIVAEELASLGFRTSIIVETEGGVTTCARSVRTPSTLNHQPSTIDHQPSTINRFVVTTCALSVRERAVKRSSCPPIWIPSFPWVQ